jgi:hypothetical protein
MAARKAARRPTATTAKARRNRPKSGPKRPKARAAQRTRPGSRRKAAAKKVRRKSGPRTKAPAKKAKKKVAAKRRPAPKAKSRTAPRPQTKANRRRQVRPAPPAKPAAATPARRAETARPRPARPALDRARRVLPEAERIEREAADEGVFAAARSGGEELQHRLEQHTETSPALTAGDIDAKWDDAYAVGDEAPGGDNPTPDQDRVDDIGKALGVTYDDNEELQGSDKITERDRHRWELDPASSDDWPHEK